MYKLVLIKKEILKLLNWEIIYRGVKKVTELSLVNYSTFVSLFRMFPSMRRISIIWTALNIINWGCDIVYLLNVLRLVLFIKKLTKLHVFKFCLLTWRCLLNVHEVKVIYVNNLCFVLNWNLKSYIKQVSKQLALKINEVFCKKNFTSFTYKCL